MFVRNSWLEGGLGPALHDESVPSEMAKSYWDLFRFFCRQSCFVGVRLQNKIKLKLSRYLFEFIFILLFPCCRWGYGSASNTRAVWQRMRDAQIPFVSKSCKRKHTIPLTLALAFSP